MIPVSILRPMVLMAGLVACAPAPQAADDRSPGPPPAKAGMATVVDDQSEKDVVKIAATSPDHSTLVAAVKAAGLLDVLASSGPYTVFAPTNAAFEKLPGNTVADLMKPANVASLQSVLRHHVTTSAYQLSELTDGQVLAMADGSPATITRKGDEVFIGGAKIIGSARGTNGMVHVVDAVVLAPK
jgi:uncharacterized surface protein with fasciclin (FAS1) repeats